MDPLDAHIGPELHVGVDGFSGLVPWREVGGAAASDDVALPDRSLHVARDAEDHKILLGLVLEDLKIHDAQVHLGADGVDDVVDLGVVAICDVL